MGAKGPTAQSRSKVALVAVLVDVSVPVMRDWVSSWLLRECLGGRGGVRGRRANLFLFPEFPDPLDGVSVQSGANLGEFVLRVSPVPVCARERGFRWICLKERRRRRVCGPVLGREVVHWDRDGIGQCGSHLLCSCCCALTWVRHWERSRSESQEEEPHLAVFRLFTTAGAQGYGQRDQSTTAFPALPTHALAPKPASLPSLATGELFIKHLNSRLTAEP